MNWLKEVYYLLQEEWCYGILSPLIVTWPIIFGKAVAKATKKYFDPAKSLRLFLAPTAIAMISIYYPPAALLFLPVFFLSTVVYLEKRPTLRGFLAFAYKFFEGIIKAVLTGPGGWLLLLYYPVFNAARIVEYL